MFTGISFIWPAGEMYLIFLLSFDLVFNPWAFNACYKEVMEVS